MFRKVLILGLCLVSSYSYSAAGQWSPYAKVSNIFIEGNDTAHVATLTFEPNIPDSYKNSSCLSNYITIDLSTEKGKSMYSLILAARMSDKKVRVSLPSCRGSRPLVHQLNM